MIQYLLDILKSANPEYFCTFEESKMMNIVADNLATGRGFAYIEEYRRGNISQRLGLRHTDKVTIYFCRFSEMHGTALEREQQRERIMSEMVVPFIRILSESTRFAEVSDFQTEIGLPRFDGNCVNIALTFNVTTALC